ncbi:MAG: SseB family protein, partial [Lachnospiraceae bacterium]|nr:SseB family protein [Lachnospiraceae bacterium]
MREENICNADNQEMVDPFLEGNEIIEEAIDRFFVDDSEENLKGILDAIRQRMHDDGHFIIPVEKDDEDEEAVLFRTVQLDGGEWWQVAFTSQEEFKKGDNSDVMSYFIDEAIKG